MLEAADLALVNDLADIASLKQRRALAKVITLLESTRLDHRKRADDVLNTLLPKTGKSFRLGISGVPGVGKSTLIESLGLYLIEKGHRVAVLAIDPTSSLSGGSILGDKTRMERLSVLDNAFIRPSPSSLTLGGVAEKTREAMLVAEAAGFDIIIVETVGVGQSEIAVSGMTDMFLLLQLPNAGDDLQAIKKGVMEIADLIVINKVDIDPDAAMRAQLFITSSLRLLGFQGNPDHASHNQDFWHPTVMTLSALEGKGVPELWEKIMHFEKLQRANGKFESRRKQQSGAWMWDRIDAGLKNAFRSNTAVQELLPSLTAQVNQGTLAPSVAARRLLESMGHEFF
ncbi:methylmalonyl Co-A mutase-associated GTPase MeaB [Polynucleobacter asymbioticus]|jgi:LAO/AO transport system kinase|uniref:ATPase/protein kinase n=1 Tax=Polynucleobacter asymbioticus TaxID=576611 RepID=A0AAC9IUH1_9BURK|nr:methylmalonyl Co-A mutase-associated GTPase MeaB [Polynucleobacter asymbioticus]APB98783.1 ATPase/protein kinase [Polynucleobacter asymbioticus]APC01086.1 ATPase/protein kinase [Polynucleobacter asymbioticus]